LKTKLKNADEELQCFRSEVAMLQEVCKKLSFEEEFMKNDSVICFYTGLPNYNTLALLVKYLTSGLPNHKGSLSLFQEIFLVLMKLRLNLEQEDLAYRFQIDQSTVSRIYHKWILIMGDKLRSVIRWPTRDEVRQTMPFEFRQSFSRCVCIIDCTEIFIERPSDLKTRAETWSNYKQHNTIKFLIAISPQGIVSFISKAWGGRTSDKYLTEQSGLLDNLIPGDLVLADRGFTIHDSVGLHCAEVKVPLFTKKKKQLSHREVDMSREISHVRIHVERVIGMIKQKYKILQGILPITTLKDSKGNTLIDEIVVTCCALCNICVSIVPFN
jgi:hypothetical protein